MKKKDIEFRYYDMPVNSYVLAMLGNGWEQEYGIEQAPGLLHFHNYLEIGYCYDGSGILTIADQKLRYSGNMFSIIPANIPHTTNSDPGHICKWEFLFIDIEPFVRNEMRDALISVSRALLTAVISQFLNLCKGRFCIPRISIFIDWIFTEDPPPTSTLPIKTFFVINIAPSIRSVSEYDRKNV